MKFEINIFIYIIFSLVEMNVVSQLANQMTQFKADKKKETMLVIIAALTVILLDILVYDYTKTSMRSMTSLALVFIVLKLSKEISFTKTGIQMLLVTILLIIADIVLQLVSALVIRGSLNEGINFTIMYGLLLLILNVTWLTMRKFNISFLNLNKSKL